MLVRPILDSNNSDYVDRADLLPSAGCALERRLIARLQSSANELNQGREGREGDGANAPASPASIACIGDRASTPTG